MKKQTQNKAISPRAAQLRRLPLPCVLLALGLLWPVLAALVPGAVPLYVRSVYPVIQRVLTALTGWFSFSLAEWLLYALILLLVGWIVSLLLSLFRRKGTLLRLVRGLISLLLVISLLLNGFYLFWGLHYFAPSVQTQLALPVQQRPVEELEQLCRFLADRAALLRKSASQDADGVFAVQDREAAFSRIQKSYETLCQTLPLSGGQVNRPKAVTASEGLSLMGICGVFVPFTGEPCINVHQPALQLYSSAAHECAHSLGVAREDEANFVAYLACLQTEDVDVQYSGVMTALLYSSNQLHRLQPEAWQALRDTYSPAMCRDLAAYSDYWRAHEGPLEELATQINDAYLQYNQQQSGVDSYGEMVDLLLAYYAFDGEGR